jgi:hypothetical protein
MVHGQEKNAGGHKNVCLAAFSALYRGPRAETRQEKRVAAIFLLQSIRFCDIWAKNHSGRRLGLAITLKALARLSVATIPAL